MHGCKGSVWLDGSGKVGRQSRFGQNLPPLERIQPENLATACHTLKKASGNGNKRLMGNQKKEERNGLQTKWYFDAPSVSRSFLFLPKVRC